MFTWNTSNNRATVVSKQFANDWILVLFTFYTASQLFWNQGLISKDKTDKGMKYPEFHKEIKLLIGLTET